MKVSQAEGNKAPFLLLTFRLVTNRYQIHRRANWEHRHHLPNLLTWEVTHGFIIQNTYLQTSTLLDHYTKSTGSGNNSFLLFCN